MSADQNYSPSSILELVATQARVHPHLPALFAPQRPAITYATLNEQIHRLGHELRAKDVTRSDRVAIVLPNGPEMAATFLGVGSYATCAPLNPAYGAAELEFFLTDLAAKAVVTTAGADQLVREIASRLALPLLDINSRRDVVRSGDAPLDYGQGDDAALVLHTSGTTSRPKQVPLTHRNLCASARNIANILQLSADDCCLNVMPLFHIHGLVGVLLSSMFAGGSVVCTSGFQSSTFAELFREFRPSWYSAVPTIHQAALAVARAHPNFATGGRLRLIRSSSSALSPTLMNNLENTFGVPVIESYGMTEAAHQMASNPLPPAERKPGSVGLPAGPEMAIMDEQGNLLPAEVRGEIVIRGFNVTAGYINNDEANRAAFSDGWFRTGDLGRVDSQGYFYLTGRKKEMINRGGENISPREIDEALLEHPTVSQAVAFAVPHASLGEDLAAAVVLHPGTSASESELREFVFQRLADFKVPSRILLVDAIPKGPTGKLQRIGLHEQFRSLLYVDYAVPVGETETKLASIWSELLDRPQVGRDDNYFLCGGDSLLAARLAARLRLEFEVDLSLRALFQQPTVAAQAALVDAKRHDSQETRRERIDALLQSIEQLSEEEAARLLQKEQNDGG
jgi:acyl-CoA synthetase (AMP-forming)/AMP-acid ligase II/aryl carrier-like protein